MNLPVTKFNGYKMLPLAALILLAGTGLENCKTLTTRIEIKAPAHKVMTELRDTKQYKDWNPFLRVDGEFKLDDQLNVQVRHDGEWMKFEPKVIRAQPNHIQWRGRFLMPGVFTGEHGFRVISQSQDRVVFEHYEDFSGVLVPFFNFSNTEKDFKEMNEALKKRVEAKTK